MRDQPSDDPVSVPISSVGRGRGAVRVLIRLALSFVAALGLTMGAARVLPAGAGGVNNLLVPVVLFPLTWVVLFLLAWLFRSGEPARRRLYVLHSWTGLLLGLLALVVFFTGAVAVFASELGTWVRRGRGYPALEQLEHPRLTALVQSLSSRVDPAFREEVSFWQLPGGPVTAFLHKHETDAGGKLVERGVRFDVHPATHEVVLRREGVVDDVFEPTAEEALARFFIDLHVRLLIPAPVGLYVTGVVGFALLLLVTSGAVVHRRFFAEAFQRRRLVARRLLFRDLHTVTGVWTLPYAVVVAFTGAYFSFGDALLFPGLAKVSFGGNEEKLMLALSGVTPPPDVRPSPAMADLDAILSDARRRVPGPLSFAAISHPGRKDARVDVHIREADDRLTPAQLEYDGVTGAFVRAKPAMGTAPSVGASLAALIGPLHFGNFAGVVSKSLWAFLGVGCCLLVCSGLAVWSERRMARAERHRGAEVMRRVLIGTAAGMPAAAFAAVSAWAAALAFEVDAMGAMGAASGVVLCATLVSALRVRQVRRALRGLLAAGGALALLAPLAARWATGLWTFDSPASIAGGAVAVDLVFVAIGVGLLASVHAARRIRPAAKDDGAPAMTARVVG